MHVFYERGTQNALRFTINFSVRLLCWKFELSSFGHYSKVSGSFIWDLPCLIVCLSHSEAYIYILCLYTYNTTRIFVPLLPYLIFLSEMESLPTTNKSDRRWRSKPVQTSKPSLLMAFFSCVAWLYVAGRSDPLLFNSFPPSLFATVW